MEGGEIEMLKILIMLMIILNSYIYGNNYEIIEENGELFFKYSKEEFLREVQGILEENKEILSKDFKINGEKKYIEEIRFDKNYIDKSRYNVCKIEEEKEKCLFYMNNKRKYYMEKNIKTFSTEKNVLWFKNNKLSEYTEYVKFQDNENLGTITYIFDVKNNLKMIKVLNPILISVKLKERNAMSSSVGRENYYFSPKGKFIKKEIYYKYGG